jgi:putative N6-adenine-specific DNA methylase
MRLFAACAPGLEAITAQELQRLGVSGIEATAGGVEFDGPPRELYRANLHLRTANRVLLRIGEFYAAAFAELRRKTGRLAWESFLAADSPVVIKATCHKSRLYHSDAVAERVASGIADRIGRIRLQAPLDEEDDSAVAVQRVMVRLAQDRCVVSIDSSGALLHRRGYRLATAKAPLRETLAAGLLLASGWDGESPLIDPFCGSGTIAIEAALLAQQRAPGRFRRFAFMDWPTFDPALWAGLVAEADAQTTPSRPALVASDRDAGAIESARTNAERASVADCITFSRRAVSAIEPPPGAGWVVTNPPYGVRVSRGQDLRDLYAQLGNALRAKCPGWRVALLTSERRLGHATQLSLEERLSLVNGALRVKLLTGRVPGHR